METDKTQNLESLALDEFFKGSVSGAGEEELLRIASAYSLQITAGQIRILLFLEWIADELKEKNGEKLKKFVRRWLELKQNNNSDIFVMKALEYISLRKFLNEQSFKVNIEK